MKSQFLLITLLFVLISNVYGATFENVEKNSKVYSVAVNPNNSAIVDYRVHVDEGTFTLDSAVSIGDVEFDAVAGHGITTGKFLYFKEDGRLTEVVVTNVVTNAISIDSPFDYAYTTSADCTRGEHDLAVDGSVAAVEAHIVPPAGTIWRITRIMFYIEDQTAMDDSTFGGISALTNGFVLQVRNIATKNIFNIKSNGELAERMYDVTYSDKAAAGSYGLRARRTFGGISKNGAYVELNGDNGDGLYLIIQDNLSNLDHFHVVVQGNVK